jgi:aryl-alcohol dehydrogenase-like predicted oxidoreductase
MNDIRPFGTTGLSVSAIGLGTWQLGPSPSWPNGPSPGEAVRLVHAALDNGVTFIDTAPGYADGQSEFNLGQALRGRRRDEVVLCTKFGHTWDGGTNWSPDAVRPSIENSARRLGVDHIDVVVLHSPDEETLAKGELLAVLEDLRDEGLIRAFGASLDHGHEIDTMLAAGHPTAMEVRLSALYQEPWEAVDRAATRGVGTIVKVPLESGWLGGRHTADTVFTDGRARWSADDVRLRADLVDEFRSLLPEGTGLVAGALGFLLANPSVSTVIPGTRTLDQLHSSLAAATPLPARTVTAIREWHAARLAANPLAW